MVKGLAIALALVAIPPTLVLAGGYRVPYRLFQGPRLSWSWMLDLAIVVSWVAWVGCVLPIARHVASRMRVPASGIFGVERGWDRAASPIAAALLLVGATIGPIAGFRGAFGTRTRAVAAPGASAVLDAAGGSGPATESSQTRRYELAQRRYPPATAPRDASASSGEEIARATLSDSTARAAPVAIASRTVALDAPATVSDVATVALCCMGVVAITRRLQLRRRRGRRALDRPPHDVVDVQVMRAAARDLHDALGAADVATPAVRLLRVGEKEVEFFLASETNWAPAGLRLGPSRASWIRTRPPADSGSPVPEPAGPRWLVVPVAIDAQNVWAIMLEIGACVSILGPNAKGLISSFAARAYRPPESESIRVRSNEHGITISWVGSPSLENRAYVTTEPSGRADLTIVVDESAVTIHPFGITAIPLPEAEPSPDAPPHKVLRATESANSIRLMERSRSVEVRLLATVPRIDGLTNPLPAKRARRVVELLAYLAIHHPDPVSGDRLRTRVLGTPDADAAAKTLFNTVGVARHVLGVDPDGNPLLPSASRQGHYRVSALVGIDVVRALQAFELAQAADDSDVALALYRSGLDLVESEPLAGVLSGYSWWQSEGHEARLSSAVVEAACRAVRLAIASRCFEMTTWIIGRARLVDPYTERLSRAAMRAAAAAGDQARLRREWHECLRRVSELDPNAKPSVASYRLFDELVNRANGTSSQANFAAIDDAP